MGIHCVAVIGLVKIAIRVTMLNESPAQVRFVAVYGLLLVAVGGILHIAERINHKSVYALGGWPIS